MRPAGLLERALWPDGYPGMRASTAHTRALGLFDSTSPLLTKGVPIGDVLSGGGLFVYDAFELYAQQSVTGVSDPNMAVFGKIGQRKSTLIKCLLLREMGLAGMSGSSTSSRWKARARPAVSTRGSGGQPA